MGNGMAGFDIYRATHEDRLEEVGLLQIADDRGEGGGVPAFGGSVGGAWEDGEVGFGGSIFWFGESGGWGKLGFAFGQSEILQKAEILVGNVDITVGRGATNRVIGEEEIADGAGKTSSVGDGKSFQGGADGVGKECGS